MSVDVEKRNAPDAHGQQPFHIGVGQLAQQLFAERLKALVDLGDDRLVGFALFDPLVNPLLDKDALQRAEVQFVLELLLLQLQLLPQEVHELRRILLQDFRDSHLGRPMVFDDDDAAGDGDLALGERVKSIDKLFCAHAAGGFDFDFDFLGGEIVDGLDLDLPLARGVFDGGDQGIGRGCWRDFPDDDRGIVLGLDLGADLDAAAAVLVLAGVHEAAGWKVGQQFERLLLQDGDLGLEQFGKIVR